MNMKKIVLLSTLVTIATLAFSFSPQGGTEGGLPARRGIPASQQPVEFVQPNGDTLIIRLHGDEHHSWRTTEDGYLIFKNKRGVYCYAKVKDGITKPTCRQAHNPNERTRCEQKWVEKHIQQTTILIPNE